MVDVLFYIIIIIAWPMKCDRLYVYTITFDSLWQPAGFRFSLRNAALQLLTRDM